MKLTYEQMKEGLELLEPFRDFFLENVLGSDAEDRNKQDMLWLVIMLAEAHPTEKVRAIKMTRKIFTTRKTTPGLVVSKKLADWAYEILDATNEEYSHKVQGFTTEFNNKFANLF